MVSLNEEIAIAAPPEQVWPLLSDPAVVAACIPGAELAPDQGDDLWRGTIRVKFGPTTVIFRGEATLTFDAEARRIEIEGRGIDGRGASRALASGTVAATGGESTTLAVAGEFNVTGPIEPFVNSGGVHVARALLAEFAQNMSAEIGAPAETPDEPEIVEPAAEAPPAPRPPASELGAGGLLWRAFLSWLKGLFGKRS